MDASYSCRNWLTGFTRPKPPMQRQEVTLKVNISNWQNSKPTRSTFLRQGRQLSGFFQKPSSSLDQVFPSDTDSSLNASIVAQRVFHFRLVARAPVILFVGLMVQICYNKWSKSGRARLQQRPEKSRRPFKNDEGADRAACPRVSNNIDNDRPWWTEPIVFIMPILRQAMDSTTARWQKSWIKSAQLSVVMGGKSINRMRGLPGIQLGKNLTI